MHVFTQFFQYIKFAEHLHSFMRCTFNLQTKRRYIKKVLGFLDFAGTTTNMWCKFIRNKFTVLHQHKLLRRRKKGRRTLQFPNKYIRTHFSKENLTEIMQYLRFIYNYTISFYRKNCNAFEIQFS